jgi:hypothetical protein
LQENIADKQQHLDSNNIVPEAMVENLIILRPVIQPIL